MSNPRATHTRSLTPSLASFQSAWENYKDSIEETLTRLRVVGSFGTEASDLSSSLKSNVIALIAKLQLLNKDIEAIRARKNYHYFHEEITDLQKQIKTCWANYCFDLGILHLNYLENNYQIATRLFEKTAELFASISITDELTLAQLNQNSGICALKSNDPSAAVVFLTAAASSYENLNRPLDKFITLTLLGLSFHKTGKPAEGDIHFKKACEDMSRFNSEQLQNALKFLRYFADYFPKSPDNTSVYLTKFTSWIHRVSNLFATKKTQLQEIPAAELQQAFKEFEQADAICSQLMTQLASLQSSATHQMFKRTQSMPSLDIAAAGLSFTP